MNEVWKVVVTDHVFPDLQPLQEELGAIGAMPHLVPKDELENLIEFVRDADALLNCFHPITAHHIEQLERCRIIARCGTGVDNVDVTAATKKGIVVTNVPDYCVDEVSDHALALILAGYRKIVPLNARVQAGEWTYQDELPIHRLRGQVLGVLGLGRIGRAVVRKAKPFGFRILAFDPYVSAEQAKEIGAELVAVEELFKTSDVVSVHVPLTAETTHFIDKSVLQQMKPTALLVNTARGGLVDTEALVEALERGQIAGACLDVLEDESSVPTDSLRGRRNVILTPHVAFYSEGSVQDVQRKAARQVVKLLKGESLDYVVNPEVLR